MNILVSVIVPMYNVKDFIGKCAQQLFEQTLQNIEIIFVDDKSPDDSARIVADLLLQYPARQEQVQIIKHDVNLGLPSARNTGLKLAKGEFIFHCDGDDWVELNALEQMYNKANLEDADIVWTDWFLTFKHNERYMAQPNIKTIEEAIKALLNGKMRFNVWNKLIKRRLYIDNNIFFPDGRPMAEDMTIIKLFCHAENLSYISKAFYHYVQTNPNAYTKQFSEKGFQQLIDNTNNVITYLEKNLNFESLRVEFNFFKLNVKLPLLIGGNTSSYEKWLTVFPESNAFIFQNRETSFRIKVVQFAANIRQFWLVKLHYYFIIRFVYGVIFK